MKEKIHPKYGSIKVITTDGGEFEIKSCLAAKLKAYHAEMSPDSHPAWTGQNRFTGPSVGNMKKFEKKYPGLDLQ